MSATSLDHCVIAVSDWDAATAFYRDVEGAEVVTAASGRVFFRLCETQLSVHGPGVAPSDVAARGAGTSVYFRDPDGSLLEFITYD